MKETKDWIVPLKGKVKSKFGPRIHPVTKEAGKMHNGVDIPAPVGVNIVAPADGKVLKTFEHEFGGLTIYIMHDNGFETRYCHLDKILVRDGQRVKKGDVIALNGNTGRSTGPHLHFGMIDTKRNYVDPEKYLKFE